MPSPVPQWHTAFVTLTLVVGCALTGEYGFCMDWLKSKSKVAQVKLLVALVKAQPVAAALTIAALATLLILPLMVLFAKAEYDTARNWLPVPALLGAFCMCWLLWKAMELLRAEKETVSRSQELQAQYGVAEDLGNLGSWVFDIESDQMYWSLGTHRLFGVEAALGPPSMRGFVICVHPDDQERWQQVHKRAAKHGTEARIEYRYVKNGSDLIWVRSVARCELNAQGKPTRLAGIVQDVTAVRSMAQQIARSEAKFRDLTQMSSDWYWETDSEHKLSYLSESAYNSLGSWVKHCLHARRWEGPILALPGTDWEQHKQLLESRKPFDDLIYTRIDTKGELHHFQEDGRPLFNEHGEFLGYRGVGRDITREREQQILLEIEREMATIMREQADMERVFTALIITLCGLLAWTGGCHIVRTPESNEFRVRERWGYPAFTKMLTELAPNMPLDDSSVEGRAWGKGHAIWMKDLLDDNSFRLRYQTDALQIKGALLAPILDEEGGVLSSLLFVGPVAYNSQGFLSQVSEILSRTLSLFLQRKNAEQRLVHSSLHDALTGLPNRVYLSHQLETRLRAEEPAAVCYVDLDRFKIINDTLGHSVGDQVLIEVSRRMRDAIRPEDVAGRIGGDEFIILLTKLDNQEAIENIMKRLLKSIERPFVLNNRAHFLSASIGVAISPAHGMDAKHLIKCADSVMYSVKSEGRNGVRFFAGELSDERSAQLQLASEMPQALQRGEVSLFYQPILSISQRRLVGLEALIRWNHPTRGLLLPDQFLPVAEQSNLIREIGMWSIKRALDDRLALGLSAYDEAPVSVNISAKQLSEDTFLSQLNKIIVDRAFPSHMLRLEITESSFIENPDKIISLIGELRRMGVQIIIDNFGTGFASLSYLKNLPVDGLKIDRSFIDKLEVDRSNAAIVQAIVTLAQKLGMKALAEGVETAGELRALRDLNFDVVQGSIVCEPLPVHRLAEFVRTLPMMRELHAVQEVV
jgi:diguanylate cyclase (GGDEF)-like protein